MAIDTVREYFKQFGRQQDIMEFSTSSATVELAAQALNVIPARIAKTLSFRATFWRKSFRLSPSGRSRLPRCSAFMGTQEKGGAADGRLQRFRKGYHRHQPEPVS